MVAGRTMCQPTRATGGVAARPVVTAPAPVLIARPNIAKIGCCGPRP